LINVSLVLLERYQTHVDQDTLERFEGTSRRGPGLLIHRA
jgi:hypothetical protein